MSVISRVKPTIDSRIERQILTGMIISDRYIQNVLPMLNGDNFRFPYSKIIAGWCKDYFEKYNKAPGTTIEDIFSVNIDNLNQDDIEPIKEFLSSISDEYAKGDTFNVDYILDKTEVYFRLSSIDNLTKDLNQYLFSADPEPAELRIGQYTRPQKSLSKGGDPIRDLDEILKAFRAEEQNALFKFPGELGNSIGSFSRGQLISIVGPSGVGKSWWLLYMATLGVFRGFNVVFFSFEMPRDQCYRRVQHIITGLPKEKYGKRILIPVWDCVRNQYGICSKSQGKGSLFDPRSVKNKRPTFDEVKDYLPCSICRGINRDWIPETWHKEKIVEGISEFEIIKKYNAVKSSFGRCGDFHIAAFPSGQMSINDIKTYVKNREYYDGVIADIIITDSADKMKSDERFSENRDGIYNIWKGHKALAEELHSVVITASHSNTERTGKRIKQGDWAEDIRKLRECDTAFALNQSPLEKTAGRYAVSMIKVRDDDFDLGQHQMVLSQLKIGRPYLDSAREVKISPDLIPSLGKKGE